MKPLELTVYPQLEKVGRLAEPGYIVNRRAVPEWHVPYLIHEKRLTDAELAAEYWRAQGDESMICEGYSWSEMCGDWTQSEFDASQRATTLLRFATLPHYDEESNV